MSAGNPRLGALHLAEEPLPERDRVRGPSHPDTLISKVPEPDRINSSAAFVPERDAAAELDDTVAAEVDAVVVVAGRSRYMQVVAWLEAPVHAGALSGDLRPGPELPVRNLTPGGTLWHPDLRQDAAMPDCYRARGWRVQIVCLEGTPDHRDGTWIRVTQYGFWTESSGIAVDGQHPHFAAGVLPYRT